MLSFRTRRGPATGSLKTPVKTVLPCQGTSFGMPTLTDSRVPTRWGASALCMTGGSIAAVEIAPGDTRVRSLVRSPDQGIDQGGPWREERVDRRAWPRMSDIDTSLGAPAGEAGFPLPAEGFVVTHFIVSDDVDRSRRFYTEVLGGVTVRPGEPTYVALAN